MGFVYRKSLPFGRGRRLTLSKSGASVSQRLGRVTLSSRGRGSVRLLPGLSYRFRLWK
jgi:hypothetical protein